MAEEGRAEVEGVDVGCLQVRPSRLAADLSSLFERALDEVELVLEDLRGDWNLERVERDAWEGLPMGRRVEIVPERTLAREVDASREAMASNRRETKSGIEKVWV